MKGGGVTWGVVGIVGHNQFKINTESSDISNFLLKKGQGHIVFGSIFSLVDLIVSSSSKKWFRIL